MNEDSVSGQRASICDNHGMLIAIAEVAYQDSQARGGIGQAKGCLWKDRGINHQPSYTRAYAASGGIGGMDLDLFQCAPAMNTRRLVSLGAGFLVQATAAAFLMLAGFFFTPQLNPFAQKPQYLFLHLSPTVPQPQMPKLPAVT
jgi:hypothetical protein